MGKKIGQKDVVFNEEQSFAIADLLDKMKVRTIQEVIKNINRRKKDLQKVWKKLINRHSYESASKVDAKIEELELVKRSLKEKKAREKKEAENA